MAESLHLVIIGAGLAGLAAAVATKTANPDHRVTILESVKELAEIGVRTTSLTQFNAAYWLTFYSGRLTTNTELNPPLQSLGNI
jgi:cation diffusion facilitator CzcD-associated flavoprotein CzcO